VTFNPLPVQPTLPFVDPTVPYEEEDPIFDTPPAPIPMLDPITGLPMPGKGHFINYSLYHFDIPYFF